MCYSEPLSRDDGGYLTDYGYVLLGWKACVEVWGVLMPFAGADLLIRGISGLLLPQLAHALPGPASMRYFDAYPVLTQMQRERVTSHVVFRPRTVMEDDHGFHVAATEESALRLCAWGEESYAVPQRVTACYSPDVKVAGGTPIEVRRRARPPGAVCRVLVPEAAIDSTHHAHAMLLIPPGERETEHDVQAVERWLADWRSPRWRTASDSAHGVRRGSSDTTQTTSGAPGAGLL